MRLNGIENPIGYDTNSLSFSWIVEVTNSKFQKSARLIISTDPTCDFNKKDQLIHDSGESSEINSIDYDQKLDSKTILKPRTRYYWKVFVTTNLDEKIESSISFLKHLNLMSHGRQNGFLQKKLERKLLHMFVKRFQFQILRKLKKPEYIQQDLVFMSSTSTEPSQLTNTFYHFRNNYKLWVQYQTFDATNFIRPNNNTIGVML